MKTSVSENGANVPVEGNVVGKTAELPDNGSQCDEQ
jgi:hypothetical protein